MAITVPQLTAVISANNTKFKKGIAGAKKSLGGFSKAISDVKGQIGGLIAIGGLSYLVKDSVELASKAEGIKTAFERINNPNLLAELRTAVKGTVSDVELMKSAVKANNFKIPLEQLGTFFQFAQQRAIETGESVDYLVESITNGIARKSLPILDNLGLSATEVREEFNKTGDMAQAVANIIARDMGDSLDTSQMEVDRFKVAIEDLKLSIGELAIETGLLSGALGFLSDAMLQAANYGLNLKRASKLTEEEQKRLFDLYMRFSNESGKAFQKLVEKYKSLGLAAAQHGGTLRDELRELGFTGGHVEVMYNQIVKAVEDANTVIVDNTEVQEDANDALRENIELVQTATQAMALLKNEIGRVHTGTGGGAQLWDDAGLFELPEEDVEDFDRKTFELAEKVKTDFAKMQDSSKEMSDTMAVHFAQIGSSFAASMGQVIAGSKSFEDMFADLAALIAQSIGDILITVGLGMTPIGIPLILAGLAMKGFGAFAGAGGFKMPTGNIDKYGFSRESSSTIRGNDIEVANAAAVDLKMRIG